MVVFGIGESLTFPPVMLTIEECRTFRDGAFVADVKFVGEADRIVLIFRHGERVPDLQSGAQLKVQKIWFGTYYTLAQ